MMSNHNKAIIMKAVNKVNNITKKMMNIRKNIVTNI